MFLLALTGVLLFICHLCSLLCTSFSKSCFYCHTLSGKEATIAALGIHYIYTLDTGKPVSDRSPVATGHLIVQGSLSPRDGTIKCVLLLGNNPW